MKKILKIEIECGEKTCAIEPGKFCKYVGSTQFGQLYVCLLFPTKNQTHTVLNDTIGDGSGWLLRCKDCIDHSN